MLFLPLCFSVFTKQHLKSIFKAILQHFRCVPQDQRSFAIGLQLLLVRLLGKLS